MTTIGEEYGPCYVLGCDNVTYEDDWCYGRSAVLGRATDYDAGRELIKADIRANPDRNGLPVYILSDHGNMHRTRCVRLRKLASTAEGGRA